MIKGSFMASVSQDNAKHEFYVFLAGKTLGSSSASNVLQSQKEF